MARPLLDIDIKRLKALMRLRPSLLDTAAFFECNPSTIERFIFRNFKIKFEEFRDQHMVHTRLNIVRKAIQKAENGDNTMLLFCLKNLCGWRDKQPGEDPAAPININVGKVSDEDRGERMDGIKSIKDRVRLVKAKP